MAQQDYQVTVVRSRRRTVGIQIAKPGEVIVRAPVKYPEQEIRKLLEEKRSWIETHMQKVVQRTREAETLPRITAEEIRRLADDALKYIPPRTRYWAEKTGVQYGRITIRCQRTRWGSCTSQGNLNFNCLLMMCPLEVIDYIIVHELCHRKEMNHSARFWAEVKKVMPEYRQQEKWLRQRGRTILARVER